MPLSDWPRSAAGYETICELGKSAHGSTWKASCTTNGRVVSIKRLNFDAQCNLSFELFDAIRKEVSLSMTFSHKCIQTVHAAFMNDAELWVVVDYMDKVSVRLRSRVIAADFRFTLRRAHLQTSSSSSGAPAKPLTSGLCSTWPLSC
jgi:serine/threonine protein kinase